MIGAIIGDIVGSRFEFNNTNKPDFKLFTKECDFTDDTICTVAVADAILNGRSFRDSLLDWCRRYPRPMGGYGGSFNQWLNSEDPQPYNSFGNGAAMRVSPCAFAAEDDSQAVRLALESASCTHNHTEGMIGAVATTLAIRRLQQEGDASDVIELFYGEDWREHLPQRGVFNETCQGCVPLAYFIIDNSDSFEEAIRRAVAYGGDSDTLAAIVGSMAEALFGVPDNLKEQTHSYLPEEMKTVIKQFYNEDV